MCKLEAIRRHTTARASLVVDIHSTSTHYLESIRPSIHPVAVGTSCMVRYKPQYVFPLVHKVQLVKFVIYHICQAARRDARSILNWRTVTIIMLAVFSEIIVVVHGHNNHFVSLSRRNPCAGIFTACSGTLGGRHPAPESSALTTDEYRGRLARDTNLGSGTKRQIMGTCRLPRRAVAECRDWSIREWRKKSRFGAAVTAVFWQWHRRPSGDTNEIIWLGVRPNWKQSNVRRENDFVHEFDRLGNSLAVSPESMTQSVP
jgi:hypothetical protein